MARMPASSTAIRRSLSRRTISSSARCVTCGSMPAQHVVGAKLDDHGVGAVGHRPVEAGEPASGGVAGHAGIDDLDRVTLCPQRLFELDRKGRAGRQVVAGGERIAQRHDLASAHRPRRATPARSKPKNTLRAATKHGRLDQAIGTPYERDCFTPASKRRNHRMNDTSGLQRASPAIALAGVNLSLGRGAARVHILKDIDLNIGRGEAIGMVGPSGSGKSTLLMVMAGLERPDSGSVVVAGEALGALDEDALARFRGRNVGIVFQSFHLIPTMTALENVAVPLELAGVSDAQERAARELAAVGLARTPSPLSGATVRRRAAARRARARAGAQSGDPHRRRADRQSRRDDRRRDHRADVQGPRRARSTTLVLVTHDTGLAARCDRVVRLRSGHIEPSTTRAAVSA